MQGTIYNTPYVSSSSTPVLHFNYTCGDEKCNLLFSVIIWLFTKLISLALNVLISLLIGIERHLWVSQLKGNKFFEHTIISIKKE